MIYSTPEPWFMLSLIFAYKFPNIRNGYNPNFCQINFMRYLQKENISLDKVKNKIRNLALDFYSMSKISNDQFFLDKTPRYYHIIDELIDIFPNSKFILLQRNPLSVFASILSYNFKGDWKALINSDDRICDLFIAPHAILKHKNYRSNRCIYIKYEDLVEQPDIQMNKIFQFLGVKTPENLCEYKINKKFLNSNSVDKKSLHKHSIPVSKYLYSWKKSINTMMLKKCAYNYLSILGENTITNLEYSFDQILYDLSTHKVKFSLGLFFNSKFFDKSKIHNLLSK